MIVTTSGPFGALCGLAGIDAELHGVRARRVPTGREASNYMGHGDPGQVIYYLDGKRSSRAKALLRLEAHIAEGEQVVITGAPVL